jgi:hypothetical protein
MVRGKSSSPQTIEMEDRRDDAPDVLRGLLDACPGSTSIGSFDKPWRGDRAVCGRHDAQLADEAK